MIVHAVLHGSMIIFNVQEEYVVTPLKAITNSSNKIAANIASATGCDDGPTCT